MTGPRAVWEVARRELIERSRSRGWRMSFALLMVLAVGGAVAAARLTGGHPTDDVGLVGARSAAFGPAVELQARAADRRVRLHRMNDRATASQALRDGDIDVALLDGRRLAVQRSASEPAVGVVQRAVTAQRTLGRLQAAGLSRAQALATLAQRPLPVAVLDPGAREAERNRDLVYVGLLVLFTALIGFGSAVASSVTEEKSSRVVEVLLTTLSPRRLLAGKVLGTGALGLAELLVAGGCALLAGQLAGGPGLPTAAPKTVALVLLWFILGYAFYSVVWAAVGALVSRQEDLGSVAAPISGLLIAGFWLGFWLLDDPNSTVARIAAFLPPLAPMLVPGRVVLGDMGPLGLTVAVILELLATAGLVMLAARIYERAILHTGAPLKLSRVLTGGAVSPSAERDRPARPRREPTIDHLLQGAAVALIVAGALVGPGRPAGIALIALGLLLTVLRHSGRFGPHKT